MTDNESSSSLVYSTQIELKPSKIWFNSFPLLLVGVIFFGVINVVPVFVYVMERSKVSFLCVPRWQVW